MNWWFVMLIFKEKGQNVIYYYFLVVAMTDLLNNISLVAAFSCHHIGILDFREKKVYKLWHLFFNNGIFF